MSMELNKNSPNTRTHKEKRGDVPQLFAHVLDTKQPQGRIYVCPT